MPQDTQETEKPAADATVEVGDRTVLKFHPTHKKIRDGIPRCISCGQIDEDGWHEAQWCPGMGGALPFPTSSVKITLKADSGYRCELTARLTLEQWVEINRVIHGTQVKVDAA